MANVYTTAQKKASLAYFSRNRDIQLVNMRNVSNKIYLWKKITKIYRNILIDDLL